MMIRYFILYYFFGFKQFNLFSHMISMEKESYQRQNAAGQVNESDDGSNQILIRPYLPTEFYGNLSHESTNGSVRKTCLIIFERNTLWSQQ